MAKTIQDCLARKIYAMQNSLMNLNVEYTGTKVSTILLDITEDKYGNNETVIRQYYDVTCVISFPMDEIPTSISSTQNNMEETSTNVLHMYDVLPITAYFKTDDLKQLSLIKGSVILYKIKNMTDDFQVIPLQITDAVSKGNASSGILWQEYTLAPVVDYSLTQSAEYIAIVEEFKNSEVW